MINLFSANVHPDVDAALLKVLHSGYITQGPEVDKFEHAFGKFVENDNAVAVNSGTSALTLALRVAGVGPGDVVISTPMTCTATNLPILSLGAKIRWADVDPDTGLISPYSIEQLITPKVKAIMLCDWGGMPTQLDQIMKIGQQHGIPVIEDAAHALGARHQDQAVGSIADFTCFSFQAIKHLTTVDGGMLTTKRPEDAAKARVLRWFGIDRSASGKDSRIDQDIEEWGYKFHMNDVTAVMGQVQLANILPVLERHQAIAHIYDEYLSAAYEKPLRGNYQNAYWLYTILLPSLRLREQFKDYMLAAGIQVNQVHKRNDEYTVFAEASNHHQADLGRDIRNDYPNLTRFADRMICIPINYGLTDDDVNTVIAKANEFAKEFLK